MVRKYMSRFVREIGVFLLLALSGMVVAGEQGYRIAGIIASSATDWQVIVELPDGEQKLASAGDFLGQVKILRISKDGVVLQFPDGERQMRLSQGGFIPLAATLSSTAAVGGAGVVAGNFSKPENKRLSSRGTHISPSEDDSTYIPSDAAIGKKGVVAGDFNKLLDKQLTSYQAAKVVGLEILNSLSESARLVSYSYMGDPEAVNTPIDSLSSSVNIVQKAIIEGKEISISVEGDPSNSKIYIIPKNIE